MKIKETKKKSASGTDLYRERSFSEGDLSADRQARIFAKRVVFYDSQASQTSNFLLNSCAAFMLCW